MKVVTCFIFLLFMVLQSDAQSSDLISLRKGKKVLQTFFKGQNIIFTTSDGASRDALITNIKNDSIFLQEFLIIRRPTTYGGYILDTAGSFRYAYDYKAMYMFPQKEKRGFNLGNSGASLLTGGIILSLASGVVYLTNKDNFSPGLLIASASAALVGFLLVKKTSLPIIIGKRKYNLQYISLQKDNP